MITHLGQMISPCQLTDEKSEFGYDMEKGTSLIRQNLAIIWLTKTNWLIINSRLINVMRFN